MDSQLKKGLLEVCVLSTLKYHESYGYKIINSLSEYIDISESTLYPILKRLELAKFVTSRTKEYNGRLRKYYMITALGVNRISEFILEIDELNKVYEYIKNGGIQ